MNERIAMSGRIARATTVATRVAAVLAASIALTACEQVTCALGINDDADVTFTNVGGGTATMYVLFDGSNVTGNIGDGQTSGKHRTTSGSHTTSFRNASTGAAACSTSFDTIKACATTNLSCSG